MKWFRMYACALNDPKVQRLAAPEFKGWVNLLCLAAENDGTLPCPVDIAFALRITDAEAEHLTATLLTSRLLEPAGCGFRPHNWDGRQFQSDTSTERVRRYRAKQAETSCDASETLQKRYSNALDSESDSESDSEEIQRREEAPAAPTRARFMPPSVSQIREFMESQNGQGHHAEEFFDHYQARKWYMGKTKMSDWQAAARGWLRRATEYEAERIAAKRGNGKAAEGPTLQDLYEEERAGLARIREGTR